MKKFFIIAALLLAASLQLGAVPAYRGLIPYTQPDGSVIQIRLHGDEYYHWATDVSGRVIEQREDGFFYTVPVYVHQARRIAGERRRAMANTARMSTAAQRGVASGQKHFLVILVEFSDVHFSSSTANQDFTDLMNKSGYSVNGATGSARDFYYENSHGYFEPIFDVYGPVQLKNKQSVYGGNTSSAPGSDSQPHIAVKEGLEALASSIDFSLYDNDGDGEVDLVFMYYAGKGENDGGGTNCIWPHQWHLSYGGVNLTLGGKKIDKYACSNEIVNVGALAGKMCGIGTACHEFGHAMGLPDMYDTNGEEDEEAEGLYDFSTMCGGAYNNGGRTPPYFSIEERILLGWLDSSVEQEITESGQYVLQSVENDVAYKASCDTEGEYFLFETRGGSGWDAPLPTGMLIYHADKSKTRRLGGYYTPYELWTNWESSNSINAWGNHPCFYLIPSDSPSSVNLAYYGITKNESDIIFPGNIRRTSYQPIDWDNNETAVKVSSISYSSGRTTFTATVMNAKGISGTVTDSSGKPLQGVTVQVQAAGQSTTSVNGRLRIVTVKAATSGQYVVQTDAQGHYEINLQDCSSADVEVTAAIDNYVAQTKTVTLKPKGNVVDFTLLKVGETLPTDLYKFDPDGSATQMGAGVDIMASVMFSEQELAAYKGNLIKSVSFYPTVSSANALYVIIDFGSTRALTYQVPNPEFGSTITVSLESQNLHIPESGPVYFGYGVAISSSSDYPLGCIESSVYHDTYYSRLNLTSSTWYQLEINSDYYDLIYWVTVQNTGTDDPGTVDPPEEEDPIAAAGFNYISVPENFSFTSGAVLPLKLILAKTSNPSATVWTLDGQNVSGDSITLTAGDHTLRATLYYSDGSDETIELEMEVL